MQTPHERVGVRVRLVLALPHHAQPMPVDWKQRRRVRVVEYSLCSEDGSLVYSTCLERGRKTGLVPRAEHVLCSVPGRHHNRTHPGGSTQTAPVASRSVHCAQHNACSVSIMCGCCYNVGRRNGMTFATVPAGACAWASAFRWTATANPNTNTVPRRPPQDLVPFPHRVSAC